MSKFNIMEMMNNCEKENKEENRIDFKISKLNIFDLKESKDNFYNTEDIKELKDSIEMFGIQQNLVVKRAEEDGKYEIISGHRRYKACMELVEEGKTKFKTIPCKIEIDDDEIKNKLLLLTTNATTRILTDYEKVEQVKKIKMLLIEYKKNNKLPGRIREIIAKTLDISPTQVGRMESISEKGIEEVKEELKKENIKITTAYEISRLPKEQQKEKVEEIREGKEIKVKDVRKENKKENKYIEIDGQWVDKETGEIVGEQVQQVVPEYLKKTVFEKIKEFNIEEMAEFIYMRCDTDGLEKVGICGEFCKDCTKEKCKEWLNKKE